MNAELKLVRTACCTIFVAMLTIAATLPAAGQVETIDATARGHQHPDGRNLQRQDNRQPVLDAGRQSDLD